MPWTPTNVSIADLGSLRILVKKSGLLINPLTGREAFTGPSGQPGYANFPGWISGVTFWTMPDGVIAWYVPSATPDPGNQMALANYNALNLTNDVTYWRGIPTQIKTITYNEPFGDAACELVFPQITPLESLYQKDGVFTNTVTGRAAFSGPNGEAGFAVNPGGASSYVMPDGRTAWYFVGAPIDPGNLGARDNWNSNPGQTGHVSEWYEDWANVDIDLILTDNTVIKLFEGMIASVETSIDDKGFQVVMNCIGALYQLDLYVRSPHFYLTVEDIGTAISGQFSTISRPALRTGICNNPTTGIGTSRKGFWNPVLTGYIQDLLTYATSQTLMNVGEQFDDACINLPNYDGYYILGSMGTLDGFGPNTYYFGSIRNLWEVYPSVDPNLPPNPPAEADDTATGITPTPTGKGYWVCDSGSDLWAFGDAGMPIGLAPGGKAVPSLPDGHVILDIQANPNGGFYMLSDHGEVFNFNGATHFGDETGQTLTGWMMMMSVMPDGLGYSMVTTDGHVYHFGSAATAFGSTGFYGSTNYWFESIRHNPQGTGFWLLANHYVFTVPPYPGIALSIAAYVLANHKFPLGLIYPPKPTTSPSGIGDTYGIVIGVGACNSYTASLNNVATDILTTKSGLGNTIITRDGSVFTFGDAVYYGSVPGSSRYEGDQSTPGLGPAIQEGANLYQWTMTKLENRTPFIFVKDAITPHWHITTGTPGVSIQLSRDFTQSATTYYGEGVDVNDCHWRNAKFPGTALFASIPTWPGRTLSQGMSDYLVNTITGRKAYTGPAGEAGFGANPGGGATAGTMADGVPVWYFPGQNIDEGNIGALDMWFIQGGGSSPNNPLTVSVGGINTGAVALWQRFLKANGFPLVTVTGIYDGITVGYTRQFQRNAGLIITGTVTSATWAAAFVSGAGPTVFSAYFAPLAEDNATDPYIYGGFGQIIGPNPQFNKQRVRIERFVNYGAKIGKQVAVDSAENQLSREGRGVDPGWLGHITLTTDPEDVPDDMTNLTRTIYRAGNNVVVPASRFGIRAGDNIVLHGWQGRDVKLHVAQAQMNLWDLSMDLTVDERNRDLMTIGAVYARDRDTNDLGRRQRLHHRISRMVHDTKALWDCESGSGIIPRQHITAKIWNVIQIAAGERGDIEHIQLFATQPLIGAVGPIATSTGFGTTTPALPTLPVGENYCGAQLAMGIFDQPIAQTTLQSAGPFPDDGSTPGPAGDPTQNGYWDSDAFNNSGLIISWGAQGAMGGYYPYLQGDFIPTATLVNPNSPPIQLGPANTPGLAPPTGALADDATWYFISTQPPYLWVAIWSDQTCYVEGQIFPSTTSE